MGAYEENQKSVLGGMSTPRTNTQDKVMEIKRLPYELVKLTTIIDVVNCSLFAIMHPFLTFLAPF